MKLSKQEKAAHRAAFRNMSRKEKLDHVFTYYKWPILLGLAALIVLGSVVQRQLRKKEPVLYLAYANVVVGEELEDDLAVGFLRASEIDPRRHEVYLLRDLYLSEDADVLNHEYAYASRMKLMGAVTAGKLDLVLMNREAWDLLSRGGYLLELAPSLFEGSPGLYEGLRPWLEENEVILSDNGIAFQLGEAEEHQVETEAVQNAVRISGLPLFVHAGFSEPVYLGVIANSARTAACIRYLEYLAGSA